VKGADGEDRAGEVGGGVAAEEGGEGDDVLGLAEAAARTGGGDAGDVLLVRGLAHARRVGEAGREGDRADALVGEPGTVLAAKLELVLAGLTTR
jgi:hypothetical protein